ncbi:murein DD-endopeptidase MepM [Aliivibrio kagoshimensis]|uniref:murein DD-endopeptidase MepM n=1 Tax=Aliivibrio kagoshimensis TaxID=2910230 RepID=UPI003D09DC75
MNQLKTAVASFGRLAKHYQFLFLLLPLLTLSLLIGLPGAIQQSNEISHRQQLVLSEAKLQLLSDKNSEPMGVAIDNEDPAFSTPNDALSEQLDADTQPVHTHVVAKGETLGAIFQQYGLPMADMYALLAVDNSAANIRVGQEIEWQQSEKGKLSELLIQRSIKISHIYKWTGSHYKYSSLEKQGEMRPVLLTGQVRNNFYNSARAAGLSPNQIQSLVKELQWTFDFGKQSRNGDRFAIELTKEFIAGKAVSAGEISAALYVGRDEEVAAIKYQDGHFYDVKGASVNRAIERFPTEKQYRISSKFNPYRLHPITGKVAPHNGTDFATPVGTSVFATGNGVVVKSQFHSLAGNYVVVKYGRDYMARYLHLSQRLVHKGDKIRIGQKIALSGNSGRSTGPHLHYELIKNGRAVDSMKVPLPHAEPVPKADRSEFTERANAVVDSLRAQL